MSMADDAMVCCDAPRPSSQLRVRGGWVAVVGIITVLLALGTTVTVATVAGVACVILWHGVVRRHRWVAARIAARAERKELADARDRRARSLVRAGVREHDLAELTTLVGETLRNDADGGDRYDLDGLLDRYTELEIARTQTRTILQRFDRGAMVRQLDATTRAGKRTRRDLLERRIAHIDACRDRIAGLDDDVDEIRELICLLAQRASTAASEELDKSDDVERRVMMLDDRDIAILDVHRTCGTLLRETGS